MFLTQRSQSVYCFVLIIVFGHIYGYIEISSDSNYLQLSTVCLQAEGKNFIEFWVNASTDAHVALMTDDLSKPRDEYSQIYEIVIGGWSNQLSCIRALKNSCKETKTPEILNSLDYVQLWISWDNGYIQLGRGPRDADVVVLSLPQSKPYDVNYLAVMTHYSSLWRFYEDTDCRVEYFNNTYIVKNDTRCNGITYYACDSGYKLTSGSLSLLCGIGQQWIGEPPVCSAIPMCPDIQSTSAVTVLNQNTHIGGILSMTCAKYHALVAGDLLRTCLSNKTWDGVEPICEACPSAAVDYRFNSTDDLINRVEEMKKKLKVEREETNAYIRSKISVKDSRTSSTRIGFVFGWGILGSLLVAICLCDAATLIRHIKHGV